jgi:hypothetical protein
MNPNKPSGWLRHAARSCPPNGDVRQMCDREPSSYPARSAFPRSRVLRHGDGRQHHLACGFHGAYGSVQTGVSWGWMAAVMWLSAVYLVWRADKIAAFALREPWTV